MKIILLIFFFTVMTSNGQVINGTVKDVQGNPVEGAYISGAGNATTDSDGLFTIQNPKSNFLIVLSDFKPYFQRFNVENKVEITLSIEEKNEKLLFPKCSKIIEEKTGGVTLITTVPKSSKLVKSKDIDYLHYSISDTDKENKQRLEIWWGGNVSEGVPQREWLENSDEVKIRSINYGNKDVGFDYIGKTKDGRFWRFLQIRLQSNFYIVNSENTKNYFDNMIDNSCITVL